MYIPTPLNPITAIFLCFFGNISMTDKVLMKKVKTKK